MLPNKQGLHNFVRLSFSDIAQLYNTVITVMRTGRASLWKRSQHLRFMSHHKMFYWKERFKSCIRATVMFEQCTNC